MSVEDREPVGKTEEDAEFVAEGAMAAPAVRFGVIVGKTAARGAVLCEDFALDRRRCRSADGIESSTAPTELFGEEGTGEVEEELPPGGEEVPEGFAGPTSGK